MSKIYKYQLQVGKNTILLPEGSDILSVHEQNGKIMLWALIDTEAESMEGVKVNVFGTGEEIDDDDLLIFIGTAHMSSGLVWHVFLGDLIESKNGEAV